MFGVGWIEMLVIGIVALVVIGPKDLPVVMSRLGKVVSTIRRMGEEFQRELNKTTGLDQITDLRRSITEPLKQTASEIASEFNKPLPDGSVEPSGVIAPKTAGAESIVEEIHEKVGMSGPGAGPAALAPLMNSGPPAVAAPVAPVESPAPVEAIAPIAKPTRKPRAKKAAPAALSEGAEPQLIADTPKPKTTRKRTPKPKPEAEA